MKISVHKYREWLRDLVWRPGPFHETILNVAWITPFIYFVDNDDNRSEDGIDLRSRFNHETPYWLPDIGNCRILEMLIGLAIRLNEQTYDYENPDRVKYWFWLLISNLGLDTPNDGYLIDSVEEIGDAFDILNMRQYNPDGSGGGLFPLKDPKQDQREIEIWYQMQAWLGENV